MDRGDGHRMLFNSLPFLFGFLPAGLSVLV